jgi:glycerophosphoryl diester phosphodiesterase
MRQGGHKNRGRIFVVWYCLAVSALAFAPIGAPAENVDPEVAAAAGMVSDIVAHRGASLERPECTLPAILRAIEVGASAVEVDVRSSSDGQLFLLHDATLDRTTDGEGKASDRTLAELKKLDAGLWFDSAYRGERIPTLHEAAEICVGKIDLLLDLKEQGDDYDKNVAAVIREHGDTKRTIVGVRSVAQAERFRKLLPEARQLALIPKVEDIEAFAAAGVETIRLWPAWLADNDEAVQRVRASGRRLHLNGASGGTAETLGLLVHRPDSLLSDNPRRQIASLARIAANSVPRGLADLLDDLPDDLEIEEHETGPGDITFLNRDYRMLEVPEELESLPRINFAGGKGGAMGWKFRQPAVVFAVFDYNDTGSWSFADGRSPKENGWQSWRTKAYRGSSNDGSADVWFREYEAGQYLSGMPAWWLCLGITDLKSARKIEGFREGLTSATPPPPPRRFPHSSLMAKPRPLNVPDFDTRESVLRWQKSLRSHFVEEMLFPYGQEIAVEAVGTAEANDGFHQQEYHVGIGGEQLFRYFKLTPGEGSPSVAKAMRRPTIVCFMGHGKVSQILSDADSYQHACAAHFARKGYVVFAMENVGMEPGADTHLDLDRSLRLEGHGWYSLLFAHQRILLDQVFNDTDVDPENVGVTGVSTGGLLALSAAVMEPRVAAASVQGIFGSMRTSFVRDRNSHCACGAIPRLLPDFDLPELALLVAPRPLHISNGEKDGFAPQEAERCLKLVEPIYQKAGGKTPLFTVPPGGHAFAIEASTEFFREHLR